MSRGDDQRDEPKIGDDAPPWDGQGLPPVARLRMQRYAASPVRSSLLNVAGHVGAEHVGLTPVGEVMGSCVQHIGFYGFGGCGYGGYGAYGRFGTATVTSGSSAGWVGFGAYVDALNHGWDTARKRMLEEARSMGADGVVGLRYTAAPIGNNNREFVLLGTAVRASGRRHVTTPFTTPLGGQDVAKLLLAGWVPAGFLLGISVAVRHDDWVTQSQARSWTNTEISGYTELIHHVRGDARNQLAHSTARTGADGSIIHDMRLNVWEMEQGENHRDHVAEATIAGTAIARFHRGAAAPTRTLTMLPLRRL